MKPFLRHGPYTGKVQAVILDWAGTTVDYGCRGPVAVFLRAFNLHGISPSEAEAREPMGKEKREHVQTMLCMPRLTECWQTKHGTLPDETAVDMVFNDVQKLMCETLADYAVPVPGCTDAIAALRRQQIKIGSCTGYNRSMMIHLKEKAAALGYQPDAIVTADEVPQGRPWPWMCQMNCMKLGVHPPESVIKVGDTLADVEEGLAAGHWSVGVTRTSNAMGLSLDEAELLPSEELRRREENIGKTFYKAGAHYVLSSIADLPSLIPEINARLARGEHP